MPDQIRRRQSGAPTPKYGAECLLAEPPSTLKGARFGLLTNHASLVDDFRWVAAAMAHCEWGELAALFTPQHGLFCEQQDNMIESPHRALWQLPVFSLYSATRRPDPKMLTGLEAFLIDLQDVGCRVYTFAWTVKACLEVCAEQSIPVWLLDRPNPIAGARVEGAPLQMQFATFVGQAPIPMQHGLTLGELARYLNDTLSIGAELHVVPLADWRRGDGVGDRHWLPPSPNLPRLEGVQLYPGQVLLEGTNLSEGRGTTTPFEVCGAPFVDAKEWLAEIERLGGLHGAMAREFRFEPMFGKWRGTSCGGLWLHPQAPSQHRPFRNTLVLLLAARRLWPEQLSWTRPPYEYEEVMMPLDCICGTDQVRIWLEHDGDDRQVNLEQLCDASEWLPNASAHQLYKPALSLERN